MALPHKTPLHVHKLHRLGNLVGRIEVKSHCLLNFCPPSPTSGWMQDELWRRQSSLQDFQEPLAPSSVCTVWGGADLTPSCGAAPTSPSTACKHSSHTRSDSIRSHTILLIPTHQNWVGLISQVPDTEARQTHSLQSSGQPFEQRFFSTSTIITSNIPWPYSTQRPTLIREARKERFLPFHSSPSLPVTPHSCTSGKWEQHWALPGGQFR